MTSETYNSLSPHDKLIYDEQVAFNRRLAERFDEVVKLLKTIIEMAGDE